MWHLANKYNLGNPNLAKTGKGKSDLMSERNKKVMCLTKRSGFYCICPSLLMYTQLQELQKSFMDMILVLITSRGTCRLTLESNSELSKAYFTISIFTIIQKIFSVYQFVCHFLVLLVLPFIFHRFFFFLFLFSASFSSSLAGSAL